MKSIGKSNKFKSLSIAKKGDVVMLDYNEVAADLVEELRKTYKVMDDSIYMLLEPEVELIAFLLADEFEATVVWNLLNCQLGRGILLGMLCESIGTYYAQLAAQAGNESGEGDEDDDGGDYWGV